MEMKTVSN